MLWQKYRHVIISFGIASFISFTFVYLGSIGFFRGADVSEAVSSGNEKAVNEQTIVLVQEKYTLCGHLQAADFANELQLQGLDEAGVMARFPQEKGWQVDWQKPGMLIISREIEGYCPEDAPKRHLAELNGYVAIFRGPGSSDRMIERVTEIKVENLPEEWSAKLKSNLLEYGSEQEMLEALDSLDEFSG